MQDLEGLLTKFKRQQVTALARCISLVENESPGYEQLLAGLETKEKIPVIGITGPPGAGKSTLINALIDELTKQGKRIGIMAIDPSSPFNLGALLGDRVRMAKFFNNPNVYIRSLSNRGALGGISAKSIEILDVMKAFGFDYIFVETVGVGQSEVEIAGLADTTAVVLVPEAGDEIQAIKSGLMEIADIFIVNKADRPDSNAFIRRMKNMLHDYRPADSAWMIPVLPTVAEKGEGISAVISQIDEHRKLALQNERKILLLTDKALKLIQTYRMRNVDVKALQEDLTTQWKTQQESFNLYQFVRKYF